MNLMQVKLNFLMSHDRTLIVLILMICADFFNQCKSGHHQFNQRSIKFTLNVLPTLRKPKMRGFAYV